VTEQRSSLAPFLDLVFLRRLNRHQCIFILLLKSFEIKDQDIVNGTEGFDKSRVRFVLLDVPIPILHSRKLNNESLVS
jgi:hypothetical protein